MVKIKGFSSQLGTGLWFGFAAFAGIQTRSWNSVLSIVSVGCFFAVPAICGAMVKHQRKTIRRFGQVGLAAFGGAVLLAMALTVERLYAVNAVSYPELLATRLKGDDSDAAVLQSAQCVPMEVWEKTNGWLIRCGLTWLNGPVFLTSKHPFGN